MNSTRRRLRGPDSLAGRVAAEYTKRLCEGGDRILAPEYTEVRDGRCWLWEIHVLRERNSSHQTGLNFGLVGNPCPDEEKSIFPEHHCPWHWVLFPHRMTWLLVPTMSSISRHNALVCTSCQDIQSTMIMQPEHKGSGNDPRARLTIEYWFA
jgi:hypothetical protein